jgi:hypothetical protein
MQLHGGMRDTDWNFKPMRPSIANWKSAPIFKRNFAAMAASFIEHEISPGVALVCKI